MFADWKWSWQEFCGSDTFEIWVSDRRDLSHCFQLLCLQMPILSTIAVLSAYDVGKGMTDSVRRMQENRVLKFRMGVILLLACIPAAQIGLLFHDHSKSLHIIDYGFAVLASFCWLVHCAYVNTLRHDTTTISAGSMKLISLWIMLSVAYAIHLRSTILNFLNDTALEAGISLSCAILTIFLQILYGLSLILSDGYGSVSGSSSYEAFVTAHLEDHHVGQNALGEAMKDRGYLSKLFFVWVADLMKKGAEDRIRDRSDLYNLPAELEGIPGRFVRDDKSVLRVLHREFAVQFYSVGILKLISDLASLATPLLLNELLLFLDDPKIPMTRGYQCAGGIFLASVIGSLCTVHFDFYMGMIRMKFQFFLTQLMYSEILRMDASLQRVIGMGTVVNLVSIDMERIANACSSIHALWSMPFELGVTLYLLYRQVGVASLCGVACSILLIPINKIIAQKISDFSARMMEAKDKRVGLMSEFIRGIRQIKLYVWEDFFVQRVLGIRANEVKYLKYRKYLDALCVYFWATTPVMISTLTFTVFIYLGGDLNAAVVFTSLSLLSMLRMPLNAFPWILNGVAEAWVSVKRVNAFIQTVRMNEESRELDKESARLEWDHDLSIENMVVCLIIGNQLLRIQRGQLVGVSGPVGGGKSLLLHCILGEKRVGGTMFKTVDGEGVGYAAQVPWIQQGSVRDNIVFNEQYDGNRYRAVIEACALTEDIRLWADGDEEIIGESGCTLSGGQKARIALARAVYRDVDVYLLDDILSSVDREVASHIFQECILKLLAGKTRIMVTQSNEHAEAFNWWVEMKGGKIDDQGPGLQFSSKSEPENEPESERAQPTVIHLSAENPSNCDTVVSFSDAVTDLRRDCESTNERDIEVSARGAVNKSIYYKYWISVGARLACLILLSVVGMQVSRIAVDWWLSVWVSVKKDLTTPNSTFNYLASLEKGLVGDARLVNGFDHEYFLAVYLAIGAINGAFVIVRSFSFAYGGVRAAIRIHKQLIVGVSEASMQFFYSSPLGRILNRFSSDTYTVDDELPFDLNILLAQVAGLIGVLVTTMYGIPWLCLFVAPLMPVYYWLQNQYRMTSRELKRIYSASRSKLYCQIGETITGLTTIRAFNASVPFALSNIRKVNALNECQLSTIAAQAWLNMRLQFIGVCIIGAVCAITILQRNFVMVHAGFVGLAITYALTLTGSLEGVLGIFVETERKMVALERLEEYIQTVEKEPYEPSVDFTPLYTWPCPGAISFNNVSLKYREDSAYSLKDVTFKIAGGERIGIVGRTGAGKSSLFSSLFRLTDACEGRICIDDINIRFVPLKLLRSRMTIIPQDPFIFAGSVRENLDPLQQREEFNIWDLVTKLDLQPFITKLGGIYAQICDASTSLSVGEKQLICLMRAVLRNSRIVCIDEATANIDREMDERIRIVIKNAFTRSTVLIIAHRVETVLDCDRVLVMGEGEVLEFDSPQTLLGNEDSHFSKLVKQKVYS